MVLMVRAVSLINQTTTHSDREGGFPARYQCLQVEVHWSDFGICSHCTCCMLEMHLMCGIAPVSLKISVRGWK